ncbi:MAG: polysaccharide deacetylase family protein [Hyphomicrobiaceae bacterium]|nr:polysaccharide deacetylase family protein [Hyphomicrobiaceae bacterium]
MAIAAVMETGTVRAAEADRPAAPACGERASVLGVSRVVEIDTTGGPRLGNMQYPDIDFLKPGEVVLTFDDGPLRRHSLAVLNALERHCTKAIFFMVGRMALVDPAMVREIAARGHTVGTHTWTHKNIGAQGAAGAEKEIELGISAISAALGKPVAPFFRFPYLSDPKGAQGHLKSRDQAIFSIDVDSLDFRTRSGDAMVDRVMAGLRSKGKGILLMHDIQRSTAAGVERLLDALARGGYKVVHLVAKAPSTTLADYDEMAAKELARYQARGPVPLASRSVVWPISADPLPASEPLRALPDGEGETRARPSRADAAPLSDGVAATGPAALGRRPDGPPALKPTTGAPQPKNTLEEAALPETDQDWTRDVFRN